MNGVFNISLSRLIAQRQRMNTIAGNIANANATQDADGNISPFQRRIVTFTADSENADSEAAPVGVKYRVELETQTPFHKVHEPGHQHADKEGYVLYPNIDMIHE